METTNWNWPVFYMEFADKLLGYKNNRTGLLEIIKEIHDSLKLNYPFMGSGEPFDDICPFTVFGSFNKGITDHNRVALMRAFAQKLNIMADIPTRFDGIPVLNNMKARFFEYKENRKPDAIPNLWDLFETAIKYADTPSSDEMKRDFLNCYDKVVKQPLVKWNITMGLYWIRPYMYLNLDTCNREYLLSDETCASSIQAISSLKELPAAKTYLELIDACKTVFKDPQASHRNFPELSREAWRASDSKSEKKTSTAVIRENPNTPSTGDRNKNEIHYWIYTPGERSIKWEEFYTGGIMGIGWDGMGDLNQYPTKNAMRLKMKELYGQEYTYINDTHATWQFAKELQAGDIVYAKKGLYLVIGRGMVESGYFFDETRSEYRHIHKIKWTHRGEWEHPGQAAAKTLTDITSYTEYVQKLETLFLDESAEIIQPGEKEIVYEDYSDADFLDEVFMAPDRYNTLINLLRRKKNILLQGAPGVGKTFAAKRLAYSVMGQKDAGRVVTVQFHQSYSYEDFIMGYRPAEKGFELTPGPFYQFCKKAQDDDDRDYFFIIDEINRGNLSKIFGELMLLIEADKRGEKMRLIYSNELFSVPGNVYIIGMMNTADRSLAMIDYALRRRFAFFEMEPAFDSEGFRKRVEEAGHPEFTALIEQVKALNEFIGRDEALGAGFRIGHSFLCPEEEVTVQWLSSVIEHELIPLLNEYWFDEPDKINQWTGKLRKAIST
jgi:5-methylcytosine-specific restriction protein B